MKHKGSVRHHGGKYQYLCEWTRPDLMFFCCRMSAFNITPNNSVFQQIKKGYRCLAGCFHRPIFYPRGIDLRGSTTLKCEVSVGLYKEFAMTNHLAMFADSGERKSMYDNKAIGCTITTFNGGIATDWKASTLEEE